MMKLFSRGKATATAIQNWQKNTGGERNKNRKASQKGSSSVGILHITQISKRKVNKTVANSIWR